MFVVTFYSYKGGGGRTSALMNCAHRLATMGKRVFVIDFDLEAPGIDSFDFSQSNATRPGLVEYIGRFMESNEVAPLDEFVFNISDKNVGGAVLMMPAGRKDENYQASLSRLDWKVLYKQKSGFLFVENLKAAIQENYDPDYVLIDSRTGLTDVSGICTLQLPDLVVLLFSLNNQNVRGTAQIYNSIKFNKLNRQIKMLLVASPIPDVPESIEIRRERFENARKCIGPSPDLILPFDPFMAFQETIAVTKQSHALTKGYDELTSLVMNANAADVLTLLKEARRLAQTGNTELAELKYQEVVETRPDTWEAWTDFGIFQRTRGRFEDAMSHFKRALELSPNSIQTLTQMSSTALQLNRIEEAKEYANKVIDSGKDAAQLAQLGLSFQHRGLPEVAYGAYKKAADLSPVEHSFSWGEAAMALGFFEEAFKAYGRVMEETPTLLAAVYNTAYAAEKLGRTEAEGLFQKAVELFEHHQSSGSIRSDANAMAAMAFAYRTLNRPDHALRLLRNARRLATSSDSSTFFSATAYTYVPKHTFIDEINAQIEETESKYKELPSHPTDPTLMTAMRSQGEYILTFKRGIRIRRRRTRTLSGVTEILNGVGIDPRSVQQYVEQLGRGHPVQVNVDTSTDSIFGTND
jgi:tetratricopeptide (TPR) repeat protein